MSVESVESTKRSIRIVKESEPKSPPVIGEVPEIRCLPKIVHIDDLANPFGLRKRYRKFQQEHPYFVENLRLVKEDAVLFYDNNGTKILRGVGVAIAAAGMGVLAVVVYKHIEKK